MRSGEDVVAPLRSASHGTAWRCRWTATLSLAAAGAVLLAAVARAGGADAWQSITRANGLPGDDVQVIEIDPDGVVWIGTLNGLARQAGGKLTVLPGPDGKPMPHQVWDVLRVDKDTHWIGTSKGAIRLSAGRQETFLQGKEVAQILPFGKDRLIAKAGQAVMVFDGKEWKEHEFFKGKRVEILTPASDGTVWVTVEADGVFTLDPAKSDPPVQHLRGTGVKTVLEDAQKRIWAGTWYKGVMVHDGKTWARHLAEEKSYVLSMRQDAKGNVWVATSAHGLYRHDGAQWVNDLREEGSINMLEVTRDGRVWISSQSNGGLRCWDGQAWRVSLDSPLPIRCLAEAADGTIWAGGVLDGVHVLKGK